MFVVAVATVVVVAVVVVVIVVVAVVVAAGIALAAAAVVAHSCTQTCWTRPTSCSRLCPCRAAPQEPTSAVGEAPWKSLGHVGAWEGDFLLEEFSIGAVSIGLV